MSQHEAQPQDQGAKPPLRSRAWQKLKSGKWWLENVAPIALRTTAYAVFTGAASLIPLFLLADSKDPPAGLFDYKFLAGGDLLIISLVLIVGALGDLIYSLFSAESKNWRLLLTAMAIGQLLGGTGCVVGYVMGGHKAETPDNKETTVAALTAPDMPSCHYGFSVGRWCLVGVR